MTELAILTALAQAGCCQATSELITIMTEQDNIETITKYRTSDGEEFWSMESAKYHAGQMDCADKANDILDAGGSVADALRVGFGAVEVDPAFEKLTKSSKLVISHWQCRDTPGYKVQHFTAHGKVKVYGNAGSWSGSYGGDVSLTDLARYASDERNEL